MLASSPPNRFTIRELAESCHVSVATASRALNGKPGVSAELRAVIRSQALAHGFTPNQTARRLRVRRTNDVYVISRLNPSKIPTLSVRDTDRIYRLTDMEAHMIDIGYDSNLFDGLQRLEDQRHPRAFILIGPLFIPDTSGFARLHTPTIFIASDDAPARYPAIMSDDRQGTRQLTERLIAAGHTSIGVITERRSDGTPFYRERIAGYREALESHGIAFNPSLVLCAPVDNTYYLDSAMAWARESLIPRLKERDRAFHPTALLILSDYFAFAVNKAVADAEIHIPRDLSLASFGGWDATRYLPVTIESWVQPINDFVYLAVTATMQLIKGVTFHGVHPLPAAHPDGTHGIARAVTPQRYVIPGYLRVGQSVGPPSIWQ